MGNAKDSPALVGIAAVVCGLLVTLPGSCAEQSSTAGKNLPSKLDFVGDAKKNRQAPARQVEQFEDSVQKLRDRFDSVLRSFAGRSDRKRFNLELGQMREEAGKLKTQLRKLESPGQGLSDSDIERLELDMLRLQAHDSFFYHMVLDDHTVYPPLMDEPIGKRRQVDEFVDGRSDVLRGFDEF